MSTTTAIETTGRELTPELADLMEHEKAIKQGLAEVGHHLMAIRDGDKFRSAGYDTFETYCKQRWGISRSYAFRQIEAAKTIVAIEDALPIGNVAPANEAQVRPLAPIARDDPAEAADIWREAVEQADGAQPTAAEVAEVVERRRKPQPVPKPAPKADPGAPPHPAQFSDAVLDAFRELLAEHHDGTTAVGGRLAPMVLDPFAGTGRIHELRPDWGTLGVEIEPEWAALHEGTTCGDSRHTPFPRDFFDAVATSPAYGNRLADAHYNAVDPEARRTYTLDLGRPLTEGNGAGMQWGPAYRQLHEEVWAEVERRLRPGGLLLLNCKDHQRDGRVISVIGWHTRTLVEMGLVVIDVKTLPAAGLAFTTAKPFSEVVIAFRKPWATVVDVPRPDEWQEAPVDGPPASAEEFATVDAAPLDDAHGVMVAADDEPEIVEEDADEQQPSAKRIVKLVDVVARDPVWLTKKPWATYDANPPSRRITIVRQLNSADRVRHVAAYERAHASNGEVLVACDERLTELRTREQ